MFLQTTNWQKQIKEVTQGGKQFAPHIATQYVDQTNAIRITCGAEQCAQLRVEFYITSQEDIQVLEAFFAHFGLPRNGYQIVDVRPACQPTYSSYQEVQTIQQLPSPR